MKRVTNDRRVESTFAYNDKVNPNYFDLQKMKISKTMLSNLIMFKTNNKAKGNQ